MGKHFDNSSKIMLEYTIQKWSYKRTARTTKRKMDRSCNLDGTLEMRDNPEQH